MWDTIKKWWNRKWSDWHVDKLVEMYDGNTRHPCGHFEVLKRVSNDGLVQYKRVEI